MSEPRIACSLSAEAQERRFAEFADLARSALLEARRTPRGATIRLSNSGAVRTTVGRLVAAERECCSFLDFEVESGGGELVVDVSGPPRARALIDRLLGIGA